MRNCPYCKGTGKIYDNNCLMGKKHLFTDKGTGERIDNCFYCGKDKDTIKKLRFQIL